MRRLLAVAAVLVLVVLVVVLVARRGAPPAVRTPAAAADAASGAAPAEDRAPAAGRRILVPAPASAAAASPRPARPVRSGAPVDHRDGGRAEAEEREAGIMATMRAVEDDVEDCLEAWAEVDPGFHGQVTMTFEIGAAGLGKVWIAEHEHVPAGPLSCFASAIHGLDWSGLTDEPIELSNRYVLADGGAAQVDVKGPPPADASDDLRR